MRITLIDYGAVNLPAVERALQHLGASTERATTPEQIAAAAALVLPGTGRLPALLHALASQQVAHAIREALERQAPLLAIGSAMHALYPAPAAAADSAFQMFPGRLEAFPGTVLRAHLGWNQVQHSRASRLLRGISEKAWFHFAHEQAVRAAGGPAAPAGRVLEMRPAAPSPAQQEAATIATCQHGFPFVAAAEQQNLFAVQFQPEKSGEAGMDVLRNFLEAAR